MQIRGYYKLGSFTPILLFLTFAYLFLAFPGLTARGAYNGLVLSANAIIPALFPITVISVYLQKSGGLTVLGKLLDRPAGIIFSLTGTELSVVIISLLGGYPIGAKLIKEGVSDGILLEDRGRRLMRFSVNSSPGFYISFIGNSLLGNKTVGVLLFSANLIATLILTLISFKLGKNNQPKKSIYNINTAKQLANTDAFVKSVYDSCSIIINISAFSVLFSSILNVLWQLIKWEKGKAIISAITEITLGCKELTSANMSLVILAFFVAFGGFSVLCQVKNIGGGIVKIKSVFLFRLIHSLFSSAITFILLKIFPQTVETITNNIEIIKPEFRLSLSFIFLILFGIIFIIYIAKTFQNIKIRIK